jgi:hypothetical protein
MKKPLHVLAIIAMGAMIIAMTGCLSTEYGLDGVAYKAIANPSADIRFQHSDTSDHIYAAYPVSVDGHELPKIKAAGKSDQTVRVPFSALPLKMKVHVTTKFKTGLNLKALATNAVKGKNNIDEDVEFEIPALGTNGEGQGFGSFSIRYLETDGLSGGDLSALNDLAGGGASVQEALFGKQFWVLSVTQAASQPPIPGAVKVRAGTGTLATDEYVIKAKSF